MFTYNLCRWLTRLAAVGGRRRWMVITSLKGKRSQGVGAPAWGPVRPRGPCQHAQYSTGIYIRKLFTSAHDEICQDFDPSAARRSSLLSLSLSLSLCFLLVVFSSGSFFSFFLRCASSLFSPSSHTVRREVRTTRRRLPSSLTSVLPPKRRVITSGY